MSFNTKGLMSSNKQDWNTPKAIYDTYVNNYGFFDVCPSNADFDGLSIDWKDKNFCNPPYNELTRWIDKAIRENEKGKRTVFLIPARTDTQWFKILHDHNAKFIFIEGRLKFGGSKNSAPFPSMFVDLHNYIVADFLYMCREELYSYFGYKS